MDDGCTLNGKFTIDQEKYRECLDHTYFEMEQCEEGYYQQERDICVQIFIFYVWNITFPLFSGKMYLKKNINVQLDMAKSFTL